MLLKSLLSTLLFIFIFSSNAMAYIGLCCAHCGGNMPLNIPGGGIPETHEFRFKVSQMMMKMSGLKDGTNSK
ncbi:uncharacterized protein METZ01_LOCUS391888, partial [marine metagenome]